MTTAKLIERPRRPADNRTDNRPSDAFQRFDVVVQTTKTRPPAKPCPDFPRNPARPGRWCKKILGRLHYVGPITDLDGALTKWLEQRDQLLAGRTPSHRQGGHGLGILRREPYQETR